MARPTPVLVCCTLRLPHPGKKLTMKMVSHDKRTNTLEVTLLDSDSGSSVTVNEQMAKDGFAVPLPVPRRAPAKVAEFYGLLAACRKEAHKNHRGMFQYGDPTGDDDM